MKKTTKTYIKEFKVENGVLNIESTSGKNYFIGKKSCSCKGFGFRRSCGHFEEAKEKGLLKLLKKRKGGSITLSGAAIISRKDAIRKFLKKKGIHNFKEKTVDLIESKLTQKTKPEDVITIARRK